MIDYEQQLHDRNSNEEREQTLKARNRNQLITIETEEHIW